jgi:polyisoprenoid-binding protein YceI
MSGARRPGPIARWAPALFGFGFAAFGLVALGVASQKLTILVSPLTPPSPGADPIALLRDDVASLQESLASLSNDVGENLEALALHLDEGAQQSLNRVTAKVGGIHDQLEFSQRAQQELINRADAQARALQALEQSVHEALATPSSTLEPAQARAVSTTDAASPPTVPTVALSTPEEVVPPTSPARAAAPVLPLTRSAAPLVSALEPAPAPRQKKRGLFSFKSTGGLDFDVRQRFIVIASLSRVGFDGKSTLHDFTGVTSDLEGFLVTTLGSPERGGQAEIRARAASLTTGLEGRDENMRRLLEADTFEHLTFRFETFVTDNLDRAKKVVHGKARGTLILHGVSRPVEVPVVLTVDASRRLEIKGEVKAHLTDFGIVPPSVAGAINMNNSIRIWIALRLRSIGPEGDS